MDETIDYEEEQDQTRDQLNTDEQQFTGSHAYDVTRNTAESSVPLSEQLAFIMESEQGLQNLGAVLQRFPSTDENLTNSHDMVESITKAEVGRPSTQEDVGCLTASETTTTNIALYDKHFQRKFISVRHRKSTKLNLNVEKCQNVAVGEGAEVSICCNNNVFNNQKKRAKSTSSGSNENVSLLQADGDIKNPVSSPRKQPRKRFPQKKSGKNHASKRNSSRKMKAEWQFPMCLSDFTDSERQEKDVDQWLKQLKQTLLPRIQDLDEFELVIKTMEEDGRPRECSIPNRIEKLDEAIQIALITSLMEEEEKKNYQTLIIELQFALAEFYTKEDYLKALNCLRELERDLMIREGFESQKSRLYAKMAKVMELCLESSIDFTNNENELEIAPGTQFTDQNPDEVVLSYFQKALESSNNEALLQISCYLGTASVLLKCCKGQNETRNLTQVRENLRSTEILFNRISPALKCQYYLAEAFLLYHEGRYKMAKDKLETLMAREIIVDDEEHLMVRLERECVGSKRFQFLTGELKKALAETVLCEKAAFEQIDYFLADLNLLQEQL